MLQEYNLIMKHIKSKDNFIDDKSIFLTIIIVTVNNPPVISVSVNNPDNHYCDSQ